MAKKPEPVKKPYYLILIIIVLLLQLALLAATRQQNKAISKQLAEIKDVQAQYRSPTERNWLAKPIINASEKRVYLAELGLYIPMVSGSTDLLYHVTDATGGGTTDAVFMSQINLDSIGTGSELQTRCNELARVEIGADKAQPRPDESTEEPFQLADGRMVYIYLPKLDHRCRRMQVVEPKTIGSLVRQMQSY